MRFGIFLALAGFLFFANPAHAQRTLSVAPGAASEQRVALVIGNASYKDAPLRNPVNDANDMAAELKQMGFTVMLRINAGPREMRAAIREFSQSLRKGGVGLFYFAGHGVQSKGKNFLIPVNADIREEFELEDEAVDANRVLAGMEEAGNRVNIVILDACRNNPFARSWRSAASGLAQMSAPAGSFVAFATAPGSVAADGTGRNGLFTENLLRSLREPDTDIDRVFTRVTAGVARTTANKQVPWKSSSLTGEFRFRGGDLSAGTAPVADAPALQQAGDPSTNDRALWDSVKESKSQDELKAYLDQFPNGLFAGLARARLRALDQSQVASAAPSSSASRAPASTVNAALISEVVSQVDKTYIVSPDFMALARGAARELERGLLKGKLNVTDGGRGLVLNLAGGGSVPLVLDRAASASEAQQQLVRVGNFAQQADPSVSSASIDEALLRGALAALDPHSDFLSRETYKDLQAGISGTFGGLGMEVGTREGLPYVVAPFEGAPAIRAGILAGDMIVAVDGFVTQGVALTEVVARLRGAPGSRVTLSIRREGSDGSRDFSIVREIIRMESVRSRELEPEIGYIKINMFQQTTAQRVQEVLDGWAGGFLRAAKVKGLVLDLRNDPGGLLNVVIDVAGKFLPEGQLVLSTDGRLNESRKRYTAKASGAKIDVPMVVLVNKGSASGSEVLAAALQDWQRATLVGERTFGKGTVQTILPIAGGYGIKLSTAEFQSPKGRVFTGTGIEPDLVAPAPATLPGGEAGPDTQLQIAVTRLKQLIGESGKAPAGRF